MKKGSKMNKKITIIIPHLNEPDNEVYNTIKNIYETADSNLFKMIVIDDHSEEKYRVNLDEFKDIRQIYNKDRIGVDGCRQLGGEMCDTDNLLILDCHMRFQKQSDWLAKMIESCQKEPNTVFCSTSLGLGYGNMDINKHAGKYWGADLMVFDKNADPRRESRECLEPKWRGRESNEEVYEIPIILGAVYFMTKQRFDYLHGFKGLKMWGSSEVWISLKNFMAGGKNKIHTGIEVGHKYRDNSPFATGISFLYYNKGYICKTILPEEIGKRVMNCLPKNINLRSAERLLEDNKKEIENEKKYYQSIFNRTFFDFCDKFNVII